MTAPITLKLQEPIKFGSELVTELMLRKPKAKDFRGLPMHPAMTDLIDFVGRLCGQPRSVVDELCYDDFVAVMGVVGDFVPGGREIGRTPSP